MVFHILGSFGVVGLWGGESLMLTGEIGLFFVSVVLLGIEKKLEFVALNCIFGEIGDL